MVAVAMVVKPVTAVALAVKMDVAAIQKTAVHKNKFVA